MNFAYQHKVNKTWLQTVTVRGREGGYNLIEVDDVNQASLFCRVPAMNNPDDYEAFEAVEDRKIIITKQKTTSTLVGEPFNKESHHSNKEDYFG